MIKVVYINCSGGVAGDMILAAFFGLGFSPQVLARRIKQILPDNYRRWKLLVENSEVNHLPVKKVRVTGNIRFKSPPEMKNIILRSNLPLRVKKTGGKILDTLIAAEARVHRIKKENVHFHEINSIDTMVDIIGAACLLDEISPDRIICSAVNLGRPAPATLEIVRTKGLPVFSTNPRYEMATPTGLAIISSIADGFGNLPKVKILAAGYGAGNGEVIPPSQPLIIITGELKRY